MRTARELFLDEVADAYDAEHRFMEAMRSLEGRAEDPELKLGIQQHITQTQDHIRWLEDVFSNLEATPERKTCQGAQGIVGDGEQTVEEAAQGPVRDVAINGGLSKSEHYEIATYRTLVAGADVLGKPGVRATLERILTQEQEVASRLERSAPSLLRKAASAGEGGSVLDKLKDKLSE